MAPLKGEDPPIGSSFLVAAQQVLPRTLRDVQSGLSPGATPGSVAALSWEFNSPNSEEMVTAPDRRFKWMSRLW